MGNTDILTTSLPDADTENTTEHSTIFDDVFRTIAQKMPQLLIPLINEVFHTSYSEEEQFEQLRNEHYEKYGTVITDSIIRIGGHIYHLECQSSKDRTMVIRMFEYDISIALEHASLGEHAIWEIAFPQSCVLYIRNHRSLPDYHEAIVTFADGQKVRYRVPVLQAKRYTVDRIFEKRLLILLPYHILRYEHFLKHNGTNSKKVKHLLDDFREINRKLEDASEKEQKSHFYMDMIVLIEKIADYIIPKDNDIRKGLGEIMGGKILKLRSEELLEQGEARGEARGRIDAIQNMIDLGLTKEQILKKYSPVQNVNDFVEEFVESVYASNKRDIIITDNEKVIAYAGNFKTDLSNKRISMRLEEKMSKRQTQVIDKAENFEFLENFPISKAAIIKPINVMGDISGAVIVLSDTITDVEKSLAEFGGMFMGRYLEG